MATWAKPSGGGRRDTQAVQSSAEPDPSSAAEGMDARAVAGYTFHASCAAGQTFNNAAATFEAWALSDATGLWARAVDADVTVGATGVGKRSVSAVFSVASPRGRRIHVWDGTGVTGGDVTTTYEASLLTGERDNP